MNPNSSLVNYERTFDKLVQSLAYIVKTIDSHELIILYVNTLPVDMFGNRNQSQMALINIMIITEFKRHIREEAYLNICKLSQNLAIERNTDTL